MKKPRSIFFILLVALGTLFFILFRSQQTASSKQLVVHCAAGLQKPMSKIGQLYEQNHGVSIRFNFAGSGVLESQLGIVGGDLYLPADESYIVKAQEQGLVGESRPLLNLRAVMVVAAGNPHELVSIDDLKRAGIRLSIADETSAIGSYINRALKESGDWKSIHPQITVTKPTVNHVIEDVAYGTVDATIAWDSVAAQYPDIDLLKLPMFEKLPRKVSVGVVKQGQLELAAEFMKFLVNDHQAREVFLEMGFDLGEGK